MAKVKQNNDAILKGIRDINSGTLLNLTFSKNGRVKLSDQSIAVKRPNQYSNKMQSSS